MTLHAACDSEARHAPRRAHREADEPSDGRRLAVALDDLAVVRKLELVQETCGDKGTLGKGAPERNDDDDELLFPRRRTPRQHSGVRTGGRELTLASSTMLDRPAAPAIPTHTQCATNEKAQRKTEM